jgi:hypothetical protein
MGVYTSVFAPYIRFLFFVFAVCALYLIGYLKAAHAFSGLGGTYCIMFYFSHCFLDGGVVWVWILSFMVDDTNVAGFLGFFGRRGFLLRFERMVGGWVLGLLCVY